MSAIGRPHFCGVYHLSESQILTLSRALLRSLPSQDDSERVKRQYYADLTHRPPDEFNRTMIYTFNPGHAEQGEFLFTGEDVSRLEELTRQKPKLPFHEYLGMLDAFLDEMRGQAVDVTHRHATPKL